MPVARSNLRTGSTFDAVAVAGQGARAAAVVGPDLTVGLSLNYSNEHYSSCEPYDPGTRLVKRTTDDKLETATALSDLAFHILLALGDGPSHGYAIGKDVEERSGGRLDPTTGALYQALRRLTDDGLIAPRRRARRTPMRAASTSRLTRRGRRAAADEARRLDALVRTARQRKLYPQRA